MSIYLNKKRQNKGSQSEIPKVEFKNDEIIVNGYQRYLLINDNIVFKSKLNKYNIIKNLLKNLKANCNSIIDIGCSNGLILFLSDILKFDNILGLDHDIDCINLINNIKLKLNKKNINVIKYSFGDELNKSSDIICMFAIIHWIFSCTALYGNFYDIFNYIKKYVNKYLLIEWVEPHDKAIKIMNHINFNKNVIKEKYNKINFENGLKNIGEIKEIIHLENNTRFLYLVEKL